VGDTPSATPAPKQRGPVSRYLASTKNIAGCLLALVGLVLYFVGVLGRLWPLVVVALYLIGALAAPPGSAADLLRGGYDPRGVKSALSRLRKDIRGRVPQEIQWKVDRITNSIETILPKAGQLPGGSKDLFVLQRTATDYLPTALNSYLDMPREYADTHPVDEGKTARQILSDQLDLLAGQMDEVADAVNRGDVERLLAHGRFLEERFGRSQLSIEPPAVKPGDGDQGHGPAPPRPDPTRPG
jgi:hypothetical protein